MTQQTHPAVQALLDGVNNDDVDAFLGCFTEDGVVDDWGREFRGAAQIRAWSDAELIGARAIISVRNVERKGGEILITARVSGTGFNGPSRFSFRIRGNRVSRMTIRV
jgi:ketosteroid isomerase-like protein